ncbi:MAG: hypothetical protein V4525_11110 [Pseudomonadota bacterium]
MASHQSKKKGNSQNNFDPYASQRHKRGRKSHLAAAINQNIHDNPQMQWVWAVIFAVLILGSFILAIFFSH